MKLGLGLMAGVALLAGCTVAPPSGPNVVALPGSGKTYEQFTNDDLACRQAAELRTGPGPSAQQSTNQVAGSALVGTAWGAAAGAAIGSASASVGGGAAVGGALGLLAGTAVGASNAQATAGNLQYTYDVTYTQCMVAHGNTVQQQQAPVPYYSYGPSIEVVPYGYYGYHRPYYWRRY